MRTLGRLLSYLTWVAAVPILLGATLLPVLLAGQVVAQRTSTWFEEVPPQVLNPALPQRSIILDASGDKLAEVYLYNRVVVPAERISQWVFDAAVATEDHRFFEHSGVDLEATGRAVIANVRAGGLAQGGSGITQQYVKNLLGLADLNGDPETAWSQASEKTLDRKWREARYAVALEKVASKQDILTGYVNTSYFGNGAYGIQAAARYYFGIDARSLSIAQAALLVGLLQAPGAYDPFDNPEQAVNRRNTVLARMHERGFISRREYLAAVGTPLEAEPHNMPGRCGESYAPFYCTWIEQQLLDSPLLGATPEERRRVLAEGGLVIRTGLDREQQAAADAALSRLPATARLASAAAIVEPGTGIVRALGTSREWGRRAGRGQTQLLLPTLPAFQVGSVFKAFTLVTALDRGVDPNERLPAGQTYKSTIFENPEKGYFSNYDSTPWRDLTLEDATKWSVNTAFVQLQEQAGTRNVARVARDLGVVNLPVDGEAAIRETEGSLTLGARETSVVNIATAYASLAAEGLGCPPRGIITVVRRDGRPIPGSAPPVGCTQVVSPAAAVNTTNILRSVLTDGTGQAARLEGRPSAGKTGTTNNAAAVWFAGYTPQLAAAVWVGDPRGPQYSVDGEVGRNGESASVLPQLIWKDMMDQALKGSPVEVFPSPTRLSILPWAGVKATQRAGITQTP